jgi:hypothetical protein
VSGQQHATTALYPRERPGTHCTEAGWAPGPVWTGGKSSPTGIRSPDLIIHVASTSKREPGYTGRLVTRMWAAIPHPFPETYVHIIYLFFEKVLSFFIVDDVILPFHNDTKMDLKKIYSYLCGI